MPEDTPTPAPAGRVYSVEEVARYLDCSDDVVYGAIKRGELASFRVGRLMRITDAALRDFTGQAAS